MLEVNERFDLFSVRCCFSEPDADIGDLLCQANDYKPCSELDCFRLRGVKDGKVNH